MKRTFAALAVTIGLVACGGGDDDADGIDPVDETESTDDSGDGDGSGANDDPDRGSIDSLDDVPEECRDLMADYLRDIEPIVESIDWENATIEEIPNELAELGETFDQQSDSSGCSDLDFETEDGIGLLIEFAEDVAPGTVGFFEFLDTMLSAMPDEPGDGDGPDASGDIEDCDDAIAAIQGLMDEYDGLSEAPLSEIAKLGNMATAMMSCTPAQLSFLDTQEVDDFLSN